MTEPLWTIEDVAGYLRVSTSLAYRIAARPDFPRGVYVSKMLRRWQPSLVREWASREPASNSHHKLVSR